MSGPLRCSSGFAYIKYCHIHISTCAFTITFLYTIPKKKKNNLIFVYFQDPVQLSMFTFASNQTVLHTINNQGGRSVQYIIWNLEDPHSADKPHHKWQILSALS